MDRIALQQLRDLPIEGVAERLGLEVRQHKALCPFHNDHHPSLSFNVRKNTYRCFVCDAHGGTIDLVMHHLHKTFPEACQWLAGNEYQPPAATLPTGDGAGERLPFDASKYERFFERPWLSAAARHFLFDTRRLDPRVIRWCRLTSWRDRQGTDWLQIPYYDRDGKLVGLQNRNLTPGGEPRFKFPKGSQCTIYNLPILNMLHEGDPLYIAEGCSDCWALLSAGHKAIAIPSATLLSKNDIKQLSTFNFPLPFICTPTATSPANASSSNSKNSFPTSSTTTCPPIAKTSATTM